MTPPAPATPSKTDTTPSGFIPQSMLAQTRGSVIGPDVRTIMEHYSKMLRRHIVNDSEIAELCRQIYRKHQSALDLIFQYRPDLQDQVRQELQELIEEHSGLNIDHCSE